MPRKNSFITVTDQFCGAGGSSQGALKAGAEVKLALNHWQLAIDTHITNFPDTLHDCTDISACDPRRYHSTDILITSPECTNHSLAKGQKQVKAQLDLFASGKVDAGAERSRATMWDVCRFAEYHNYNAIIVENVVDARKWILFESWLQAMHKLGYRHKCVYINSMHCHPTPQSRDRMYIVFTKLGNKAPNLDFTPQAHCPKCEKDVAAIQVWNNSDKKFGKFKTQYHYCCPKHHIKVEPYYYAAFNCIDWTDLGKRIGDRKTPLRPNTITRINYGLKKFGNQPMQIVNYTPGYSKSLADATGTMTTDDHHALLTPFIVNDQQSTGIDFRTKSVANHLPTIATAHQLKLVTPFIIKGEHTLQKGYVRQVTDSMQTQTVRQSMALLTPMIVEMNSTGKSKPVTEPTATFTSGGINHGIIADEKLKSFLVNYTHEVPAALNKAISTVTTHDNTCIVNYTVPNIEDCYYRMLKPHEVQVAMAFADDYKVLGTGRDKVKQLGNAVTPPAMEWLVNRVIESLK